MLLLNFHPPMAKVKKKFFVVWEGYTPGIYASWDECKKQIHQYPAAKYMGFETHHDALEAFASPYYDFIGKNKKEVKAPDPEKIKLVGLPDFESLSVDAACSGSPGAMEYRGVYTRTKQEIFHQGPFREGTNNIGEFLALVHGLAFMKQKGSELPVYSDSKTAIKWVKQKKAATKLERSPKNEDVFILIERAEKWLRENSWNNPILKWETDAWGEIPADFGRK